MNDFWVKAITAAKTAKVAQELGDYDGAVNRAYYAMLDAAKAALESIDVQLLDAKSHGAIIARFGEHVVVGRGLDRSVGKALNTTEDLRLAADYSRKPVTEVEASQTIERMEQLLSAVADLLGESPP